MDSKKSKVENETQVIVPYGYMPYMPPEDDTIDLRQLWQTLKKRKVTVFLTAFLFLLLAGLYLLIAKPKYEAKATLEIGKELMKDSGGIPVAKTFDDAVSLKQYLDVKYDTAGKYRDKNSTSYISSVTVPKKGDKSFITITALAHSNDDAIKTLQKPIDEIVGKHKAFYDTILQSKRDKIERLKEQMEYDEKRVLPQLKRSLKILEAVNLKKIEEKIRLVKSIDLKKIEDKIKTLKSVDIKSLQEKIKESQAEIAKKEAAISSMRKELLKVAKTDPALATMTSMQIAGLQNDIGALKIKVIDLKSKIKKIEEESIPNLEKEKTRILQQTIPELQAQKRRLLEETIPAKRAEIDKMLSMTIPSIKRDIENIKTSMKEPYLVMTKVVGKIYTHDKPVKPKKAFTLVVALITGVMAGVFLAFFLEFIGKQPEKMES